MEKRNIAGYEIQDMIGEGGMGIVYRAWDPTLSRTLAVKVIRRENLGPQGKERFLREARACSSINHSNIVTVYAAGEEDGCLYLAMEFLDGRTLREIIDQGPIPWEQALKWLIDILDALDRLHQEGIVHRDLKPENIMITTDGVVKLMDFGIARITTVETITMEQSTLGTVFYMSPEQVAGKKVDPRSDLFSIGIILYQMLSGVLPFRGEHPMAIMYSITNEIPSPIEDFTVALPEELKSIIDQTLEKDPTSRFPDAGSLRNALVDLIKAKETAYTQVLPVSRKRTLFTRIIVPAALLCAIGIMITSLVFKGRGPKGDRATAERHNQLAIDYEQEGNIDEAKVEYRNAIIADPEWAVPWNNLAHIALGEGNLAEADSLLRKAVSIKHDYVAALYNLGSVLWDQNDVTNAEKYFRTAIESDSSFIGSYNNLGALLVSIGRVEDAAEILDIGLVKEQEYPSHAEMRGFLLKNRGKVAEKLGQEMEAFDYWIQALLILPQNTELHRFLAEWYERHGDVENAESHWLAVSASDIDQERQAARDALERLQSK